jgi:general secretion pathway protein J
MAAPLRRRSPGFTLVEVMVALLIMAILAALAFRGIDALARSKEAALASTDRTLKLNTGMSQFDYDISQVIDSKVLPQALMWDGATLRFARRTPDGVQLVVWTLQDRRWQRWASGSVTHMSELTDAWMRTQQWDSISANAVTVLNDVDLFQFIVCNPGGHAVVGCSWNNAGSTRGAPPPTPGAVALQPTGVRITLKLPAGELVRERELPRWGT